MTPHAEIASVRSWSVVHCSNRIKEFHVRSVVKTQISIGRAHAHTRISLHKIYLKRLLVY